jgi:hypothetical protein
MDTTFSVVSGQTRMRSGGLDMLTGLMPPFS